MAILYRAASLILTIILACAIVILAAGYSRGSENVAFLFVPGVSGGSEDPSHRNWIEVLTCDWGSVPPPRGDMMGRPGEHAGKLCFGEFSLLKPIDESTPTLTEWCLSNIWIPEMRLAPVDEIRGGYKLLLLKKVRIKSVRPSGDGATEVVTLTFSQVEYR